MDCISISNRRLFRGMVDARDYVVSKARQAHKGIRFSFNGDTMTIPWERLDEGRDMSGTVHRSKMGGQDYRLISYRWIPDKKEKVKNPEQYRMF